MRKAETIATALSAGREGLAASGIASAALDARLLLQAATGLDHAELILHMDRVLSDAEWQDYQESLRRRRGFEPVSRILRKREFYGRPFFINEHVLDPRPETETVIELALSITAADADLMVLDLGCGSGAIIVTLLAERPGWRGEAVDVSRKALETAAVNAAGLGVAGRLSLHQGSWFTGLDRRYDLIVSNPPYIPSPDIAGLSADVRQYDPRLALDGGADGLSCYRAIAAAASLHLNPSGPVVVEIGAGQAEAVTAIFAKQGFSRIAQRDDLSGHSRALAFAALIQP